MGTAVSFWQSNLQHDRSKSAFSSSSALPSSPLLHPQVNDAEQRNLVQILTLSVTKDSVASNGRGWRDQEPTIALEPALKREEKHQRVESGLVFAAMGLR